jgi:outer membrane protein assembly factor BamB
MIEKLDLYPAALLLVSGLLLAGCAGSAVRGASSWPGVSSDGQFAYVAYNEAVFAVDLETGELRGKYPSDPGRGRFFYAPPTVSPDGVLFVGDFLNQITAVDLADLAVVRRGPIQLSAPIHRIIGAPTLEGDTLLVPSSDGRLYAREADTLDPLWQFPAAGQPPLIGGLWSAPVVSEGRVFLTALDHNLYVLDLADGSLLWNDPPGLGGAVADSPVLTDDLVLAGTFGQQLRALDASGGSARWSFEADGWVWGAPAVAADTAFFGDLAGVLHAVRLESGTELWREAIGTSISASPAADQARVYVVTEDGVVSARDAATGAELWQRTLEPQLLGDPLLVGDVLLVASTSGDPLLTALIAASGTSRWSFTPPEAQ